MIHHFVGNVKVLYFGAKGVETCGQTSHFDDYPYFQNALNYCAGKGKCISLPGCKFYTSKTLNIPYNSIGGGIVSEQGSNPYVKFLYRIDGKLYGPSYSLSFRCFKDRP
ncbi:hypothetical protein [uncultured Sphingobacterium sp.]|uniref:hypothetical protein n=1 Tax=uncultured Sphingobacterium sp. TaxID=182688 RepID=UPI0025F47E19|nr:hypothetical protein [uncultured Sphingobacterium sp.]